MTRALVLFVGVLGAVLPLWALNTYPVEDNFARVLVALILSGLSVGVVGLFLRARRLDHLVAQASAFKASGNDTAQLEKDAPTLFALIDARLRGDRPRLERGEAMSRYLVSALVLVGLLGTFVGLVDALVGAREALGVSSDVTALRAALLAPMKGLSRAFGTSVAGISASAMLGLAAVFVRRAELRVLEAVETSVSGPLKEMTLAARQVAALEKLGLLGENLPAAVERMADVASRLPNLEESLVGGQKALAEALQSSVDKAAADVRDALTRGLESATKAHDDLVERAVSKAADVLEERAGALTKRLEESAAERQKAEKAWHDTLSSQTKTVLETLDRSVKQQAERWDANTTSLAKGAEDRLQKLMVLEEERAQLWREQLDKRAESDASREQSLTVLLEKAASVAERAATAAGSHAEDLLKFLDEQKANDRALVGDMKAFLADQRSGDKELVAELRAFLDERRADDKGLTGEIRQLFEGWRDDDRSLVTEMRTFLETQKEGDKAVVAELRAFLDERRTDDKALTDGFQALLDGWKDDDRALVEQLKSFVDEQKAADRALVEDMRAFLRDEKGQALAFSDDIRSQLEAWLTKAAERDDVRDQERTALEERLTTERQTLTAEVVTHLDGHAATVREQVTDMARSLTDGADALIAGGVELTSLADRFSSAVDSYKDATREWLDRLGALEVSLSTGGADNERERFGAYLDQTREVFERSLEVQRELFSGLKAMQGEPVADVEEPVDEAVPAADKALSQPNATA